MKLFLIPLLLFFSFKLYSQQVLIKDVDFDSVSDTVYIDLDSLYIVCKLSSQEFVPVFSKANGLEDGEFGIAATQNGFEYFNNAMRGGSKCQFQFDIEAKKVRLIGMSRYELGNAANDGSGQSSINLLTGDYIGDWNCYDLAAKRGKGKLVKIPTIRAKMQFEITYLENFHAGIFFDFMERCSKLYSENRKLILLDD